uniref:Uncharacterized protein n=1 Tax=Rhizophora mucronata TaxID=61149 RepID=A0A2P2NQY4_RHIMU
MELVAALMRFMKLLLTAVLRS